MQGSSIEDEGKIIIVLRRQARCVHHDLQRSNPNIGPSGNACVGGCGGPSCDGSYEQGRGNNYRFGFAHLTHLSVGSFMGIGIA